MEYDRYGYSNPDGMYIGWFDWRFITSDSHLFWTWAPVTAPLYAIVEGLFVGGINRLCDHVRPTGISGTGSSIVTQAVLLTFGVLLVYGGVPVWNY